VKGSLRLPLILGFASYLLGQAILISTPARGPFRYVLLCTSLVFDGYGSGSLIVLAESLVALHVNAAERARVMAIQHMIIMFATSPFGWIGGLLSQISRSLPFALNILVLFSGIVITLLYYKKNTEIVVHEPEPER
jgi:fucose permease